jgi:hypothetical protein
MLSPSSTYTKQTRCNNNLRNDNNRNTDFFRPMLSNPSVPMSYNHEHYMMDNNMINHMDLERSSMCTRNFNTDSRKPVQTGFQNSYYTNNFETLNNNQLKNNALIFENDYNQTQNGNQYINRNPTNTRRDQLEKIRNEDKQNFLIQQGGILNNMPEMSFENTRKGKNSINSSNYIPMARTMAIPKDNI